MLYFNAVNQGVLSLLEGIDKINIHQVQNVLLQNGVDFASIKSFEDGSLEIIYNNDYIKLGPYGGVEKTKGKYNKYNCFERDLEELDSVLQSDIKKITDGSISVINLG